MRALTLIFLLPGSVLIELRLFLARATSTSSKREAIPKAFNPRETFDPSVWAPYRISRCNTAYSLLRKLSKSTGVLSGLPLAVYVLIILPI